MYLRRTTSSKRNAPTAHTTYRRDLQEDQADQALENEIHSCDVDREDEDDDEHHGRALPELVAVGPTDPPELTPHVPSKPPRTSKKAATLALRLLLARPR